MQQNEQKQECPHQETAFCYPSERKCDSCGWNPAVAKRRLDKIKEQRKNNKED